VYQQCDYVKPITGCRAAGARAVRTTTDDYCSSRYCRVVCVCGIGGATPSPSSVLVLLVVGGWGLRWSLLTRVHPSLPSPLCAFTSDCVCRAEPGAMDTCASLVPTRQLMRARVKAATRAFALLSAVAAVAYWPTVGAVVSATVETVLSPSARSFESADLGGVYARILPTQNSGNNCPRIIQHVTLPAMSDGGVIVAHSTIKMESMQCSTTGPLELKPETEVSAADVRSLLGDFNNEIEDSDISSLQSQIQRVLRGVEPAPRQCGSRTIPAGTTVVFFTEDKDITFKDLVLGKEYKYLALGNAEAKLGCVYRALPNRLPVVSPPAIPSSTPTVVTPGGGPQNQNTGDVTASPVPTTSPTESTSEDSACFPLSARVTLESGTSANVGSLTVGSRVRVASSVAAAEHVHSDVFAFSHRRMDPAVKYTFVNITSTTGASILLTANHYMHVYGASGATPSLIAARSVKPGTSLVAADGSRAVVASVSTAVAVGLVNPHTLAGHLVVDGFQVSSYTATLHPTLAWAALAPVRWAYRAVGGRFDVTGGLLHNGAGRVSRFRWWPRGPLRVVNQ